MAFTIREKYFGAFDDTLSRRQCRVSVSISPLMPSPSIWQAIAGGNIIIGL